MSTVASKTKAKSASQDAHSRHLNLALRKASLAASRAEVPIGAVIVKDGAVLATAHNETERRGLLTAHAELIAIQKASRTLKSKFLYDCDLYVTLQPCKMCRAAIQLARMRRVYYLTSSKKFGARGKAYFKTQFRRFNDVADLFNQKLLSNFFQSLRLRNRQR